MERCDLHSYIPVYL